LSSLQEAFFQHLLGVLAGPVSGPMIACAVKELAQSYPGTERFELQFYRGLSVLISLNDPSDSGSLFKDLCPVQRHRRKYNECIVPATCAHQKTSVYRQSVNCS
jgi:hypothetical protein